MRELLSPDSDIRHNHRQTAWLEGGSKVVAGGFLLAIGAVAFIFGCVWVVRSRRNRRWQSSALPFPTQETTVEMAANEIYQPRRPSARAQTAVLTLDHPYFVDGNASPFSSTNCDDVTNLQPANIGLGFHPAAPARRLDWRRGRRRKRYSHLLTHPVSTIFLALILCLFFRHNLSAPVRRIQQHSLPSSTAHASLRENNPQSSSADSRGHPAPPSPAREDVGAWLRDQQNLTPAGDEPTGTADHSPPVLPLSTVQPPYSGLTEERRVYYSKDDAHGLDGSVTAAQYGTQQTRPVTRTTASSKPPTSGYVDVHIPTADPSQSSDSGTDMLPGIYIDGPSGSMPESCYIGVGEAAPTPARHQQGVTYEYFTPRNSKRGTEPALQPRSAPPAGRYENVKVDTLPPGLAVLKEQSSPTLEAPSSFSRESQPSATRSSPSAYENVSLPPRRQYENVHRSFPNTSATAAPPRLPARSHTLNKPARQTRPLGAHDTMRPQPRNASQSNGQSVAATSRFR